MTMHPNNTSSADTPPAVYVDNLSFRYRSPDDDPEPGRKTATPCSNVSMVSFLTAIMEYSAARYSLRDAQSKVLRSATLRRWSVRCCKTPISKLLPVRLNKRLPLAWKICRCPALRCASVSQKLHSN